MQVSGITEIDTEFEFVGMQFAERMFGLFDSTYLLVCIGVGSLAYLVHRCAHQGSFRECAVYLFYLAALTFLLGRSEMSFFRQSGKKVTMAPPRLLVYSNAVVDRMTKALTQNHRTLRTELEEIRKQKMFYEARIADPSIEQHLQSYYRECWAPTIAWLETNGRNTEPFMQYPLWLADFPGFNYEGRLGCKRSREVFVKNLLQHIKVKHAWVHTLQQTDWLSAATSSWGTLKALRDVLESIVKVDDDGPAGALANRMVLNTLYGNELGAVRAFTQDMETERERTGLIETFAYGTKWLLKSLARGYTTIETRGQAVAQEYLIMQTAPFFYGFTLMLTIAAFPLAAAYAVLPGQWKALFNFFKVFLSIKLWPVFWGLLYAFKSGAGDVRIEFALPAIYLAVPVMSFVFVNLVSNAAAVSVQSVYTSDGGAKFAMQQAAQVAQKLVIRS